MRRRLRTGTRLAFGVAAWLSGLITLHIFGMPAHAAQDRDAKKIEGPNACVECHKKEGEIWKKSHHHATFRNMPRSREARTIAKKMNIKRMKASELCLGCHFTSQQAKRNAKAIAGISCESCHGPGRDYIKVHAEFSGKKNKESETKSEADRRWKTSEKAGLIRPGALYKLAKNCYSCHVVPREDLVNRGGHPAGSPFELYSWSQGEVRHNVWYSIGKSNKGADANRKRLMFLVGLAVDLETALRSVGTATKKRLYAVRMAQRADAARKKLADAANRLPDVKELAAIVRLSHSAGLKLNNKRALYAAADAIAKEIQKFAANHDGQRLGAIESMIPGPAKFKGPVSN